MATKKTNNKKEETARKTSAPKKSAEKGKTTKKQAATSKKKTVSPAKKIERKSSVKKTAGNSLNKNSSDKDSLSKKTYRANTIRKIEPIKTEDIDKKPERESIKLLREAIKAKSKTVSKPVAVKKHLIVKEDEDVDDTKENNENNIEENETVSSQSVIKSGTDDLNKVDFSVNRFEKKEEILEDNSKKETIEETTKEEKQEEKKSEVKTFTKNTYSKSDIFKRAVSIKSPIEAEELRKNIEQSKFNQSEIDEAIENAAMIEEDTPIEDYSIYSSKKLEELKRKDIKIIETEDEMKSGGIPEIERKPAEPYVAPPHSTIKKEKKSNKTVAIIGIIIIILGLAYLGFQFLGNKNDGTEDGFYDNNITATNENETNNIISPITNDTNNTEIDNIENTNEVSQTPTNDINAVITEQTNNNENAANTNSQTNNTTVATNNVTNTISRANTNITTPQPNLPNPPVIPNPPPNPQSQNSNQNRTSYLGGNTYRTKWTDTLTSIASSELGDARRWPSIYVMNENIFKDPDSLVFNKDIKIPENKKKIDDMTAEEKRALYDDYMRVVQVYLSIGKTNSANTLRSRARLIVR